MKLIPPMILVLLATCVGEAFVAQSLKPSRQVALVGGTIYPSPTQPPIRDGVIVIDGRTIAAVGPRASVRVPTGADIVKCSGFTIMAGFWNNHVHFLERKWTDAATLPVPELDRQLQSMLTQYGFTSVFDTWSMWENTRRLRDRIETGEIAGPRIRTTGEATFPMALGGAPPPRQAAWAALGFMPLDKFESTSGSDESRPTEDAAKRLDAGADGLKLYAVSVGAALSEPVMQAMTHAAHTRQKPVFAHPTTEAGLMAALRAGVDVIAHPTPQSGPWSESVLAAMKKAGVALIPTLSLYRYETRHERISVGDQLEETAIGQLRAWLGTGGTILFGTDSGYMTEYDPTDEYVLMARAGMTSAQILASLTTAPAERFDATKQLGRIAPGLAADLTVLRRDPATDVRAFASVEYTIRDGRVIYRSAQ